MINKNKQTKPSVLNTATIIVKGICTAIPIGVVAIGIVSICKRALGGDSWN